MILRRLVCFAALAFLLAASSAAVARAADQEALEKRFKEANAKVDAGDFPPALEIYNEILEAEPTAGNVWVMRAIAKWNLKDKSGARADLAQAINLHPDNIDAYRVRGQFRYQAEDFGGSLADFNQAIERVKSTVDAIAANDPDEARAFEKNNAELYGMRAEVEQKLESRQAALKDLTHAIELKPDYVAALYLRGQLYEAEQRAADAEADYSRVIELSPKHADALTNRAWIRFHDLKWDEAVADGKKALEIEPNAAAALRVIGYSQFAKGDYADAAQTLAVAADADPTPGAAYALFVRHHALLRASGADQRLATSWGDWKDEPWPQALAKFITGQIDEEALESAAKDTSDDGELAGRACEMHFYVGLARKQAGDKSTARLRFQSALHTEQKTYIEDALASAELKRL
ncbi:MAG: tetratricopeptide repeat protein [Opitutae bacterium]|nr:tetratricopeptide repeat protein [Opitutae bacterium]